MREINYRVILAAILLPLVAAPAWGQPKAPDAAARAEADKAGKEGERLLAAHDAGRAVGELQRAYNLSKNVRFLLPLGLAYAEAERPLDALDALGRFLKETPALPDARRKEIGGKLQVMLDQVAAVVTIEAPRQSAPVKVDGRVIGTTPIETPLRLMPGQHEVVLVPAPTDPSSGARVVIDVKPGERRAVKLEPGPRSRFLDPQSQAPGAAEPGRRGAVAASTPAEASAPTGGESRPIYRKWWFWTGVGGVAVLAIGLGAGLGARRGGFQGEPIPGASDWSGGVIDARGGALVTLALGGPR